MSNKNLFRDKKAQIGETITWVVATVIVIAILGITIFVASAKFSTDKTPNLQEVSQVDTLASKSLFSYVLTKDTTVTGSPVIYDELKTQGNLNDFNGNLALTIFNNPDAFTGLKIYLLVWLGFTDTPNNYFGSAPSIQQQINNPRFNPNYNNYNNNFAASYINFYYPDSTTKTLALILAGK